MRSCVFSYVRAYVCACVRARAGVRAYLAAGRQVVLGLIIVKFFTVFGDRVIFKGGELRHPVTWTWYKHARTQASKQARKHTHTH